MQPLTRLLPRFAIDSGSISISRTLRISPRPSIRTTTCQQCSIYSPRLRQHYSDDRYVIEPPPHLRPKITRPEEPKSKLPPEDPKSNLKPEDKPNPIPSYNKHDASFTPSPKDGELPSTLESRRLAVTKKLSHLMDHLQGNIFIASQRINDLTGYSGIEALKIKITDLENNVSATKELVRSAKLHYNTTVTERASSQHEVTNLLTRKDTWSEKDMERFTLLFRMDHSREQAVQEAAQKLADAEREAEKVAGELSSSILSRYHEEQIWSDKIRRMSTWGTWGLMGVNVLLFLVFQFGFEPWRRRRLVAGFEEKVIEALAKEKNLAMAMTTAIRGAELGGGEDSEVSLDEIVAPGPGVHEITEAETLDASTVETIAGAIESSASTPLTPETLETVASLETAELHIPSLTSTPSSSTTTSKPAPPFDPRNLESWKEKLEESKAFTLDLWSTRAISIPKKEITIIALESAAGGAMLAGAIFAMVIRHY